MEHVWMNVIDSLRELIVLTIAGIVVYKLDHRELASWIMASTDCSRKEAEQKLAEVRIGDKTIEEVESNGSDS